MIWTKEALKHCPRKLAGNPPNIAWMAERIQPGDLFLDVGANVGALCIATLRTVPGARCVAFEPQTRAADVLEEMAAANGVDVELHRLAVSYGPGEAVLKYPVEPSISGWASIADRPNFYEAMNQRAESLTEPVVVTTLDTWWEGAGRPDVQLVKVDTQGSEVDVLIGGAELFRTVPYLFIEIHEATLAEHGRTTDELMRYITGFGYTWKKFRINLQCEKRPEWKRPS